VPLQKFFFFEFFNGSVPFVCFVLPFLHAGRREQPFSVQDLFFDSSPRRARKKSRLYESVFSTGESVPPENRQETRSSGKKSQYPHSLLVPCPVLQGNFFYLGRQVAGQDVRRVSVPPAPPPLTTSLSSLQNPGPLPIETPRGDTMPPAFNNFSFFPRRSDKTASPNLF